MNTAYISIIILLFSIICYVFEIFPIPIVAMSSAALMVLFKIIPANTAWAAFSGDSVLVMAGIILVGSTLFSTGAAGVIGDVLIKIGGGNPKLSILLMLTVSGIMSFVLNNTTCTVMFLPLILSVVTKAKNISVYEQKYMQILTIITSVGGLMTLIGSGVNITASGLMTAAGYAPFTFTQFLKIGAPMFIVVLIYTFTIGDKLADKIFGKNPQHSDFVYEFMKQQKKTEETNEKKSIDPVKEKVVKRKKIISALILILTITGLITQPYHKISLGTVAVCGGLACVITRCITVKEMYQKIDWGTLFLIGGTIGCGTGIANSGGGKIIADFFINVFGNVLTPMTVFISLTLISAVLTQFMSNTACIAMLIPIGLSIANGLNMNPLTVAIGITLAASCSFMTPMASPTQALVINWGSYKFMDYIKYSGPITVILNIMILILVPIMYPF